MKSLIRTIPPFDSKIESSVCFLSSLIALSGGFWFAYTLFSFFDNPAPYALGPGTSIPVAWAIAAVLFSLGGYTGLWLGFARLKRKTDALEK